MYAALLLLALGPIGSGYFGPYGRAGLATLIALILFALPPIITNTYVGMREVDRDLVEAARGMGMNGWQLFRGVELPLAMPVILSGVRLALVQVWATATIAALVAGPVWASSSPAASSTTGPRKSLPARSWSRSEHCCSRGWRCSASATSTRCARVGRRRGSNAGRRCRHCRERRAACMDAIVGATGVLC